MKRFILFLLLIFWPPLIFAADVRLVFSTVNVTTSSAAVSTRASRRILILQNYSDTTIYCKSGGVAAVVGEGMTMNPQPAANQAGGAFMFDIAVPTGTVNCIHGGSGNKVLIVGEG